jgi:hypothetical protein
MRSRTARGRRDGSPCCALAVFGAETPRHHQARNFRQALTADIHRVEKAAIYLAGASSSLGSLSSGRSSDANISRMQPAEVPVLRHRNNR